MASSTSDRSLATLAICILDLDLIYKVLLASGTGFLVHALVFVHGEWHMHTHAVALLHLAACGFLILGERMVTPNYLWSVLCISASYLLSIATSIAIYRLFFHRLSSAGIPGPWLARVSKFWHVCKCLTSKNHLLLSELQDKYGDIVRTGPNEVAVFDPAVLNAVDGAGNKCTKPAWYDLLQPTVALNTTRDREDHDSRRRIWNRAFSPEALRNYSSRLKRYTDLLDDYIATTAGKSVCANDFLYWFSFDVMGDLAYGKSFDMLTERRWHYAISWMNEFLGLLGPISPVPWLARFGFGIPGVTPRWHRFMAFCENRMKERVEMEIKEPDISSWLIDHARSDGSISPERLANLHGDAVLMTIAGSDTSAQTLLFVFYHLAKDAERQTELRQELSSVEDTDSNSNTLANCQFLNAIINETLRLFPPVPTGGIRQTGPGGLHLGGKHIPENTVVLAPRFCISRREDCFEHADMFLPERWTSAPHLVKNKAAFAPFSTGRYSCVGKNLAMMEMRSVISRLITKYAVKVADGSDPDECWRGLKDNFTGLPGRLDLVFEPVKI